MKVRHAYTLFLMSICNIEAMISGPTKDVKGVRKSRVYTEPLYFHRKQPTNLRPEGPSD